MVEHTLNGECTTRLADDSTGTVGPISQKRVGLQPLAPPGRRRLWMCRIGGFVYVGDSLWCTEVEEYLFQDIKVIDAEESTS